MPVTPAGTLKPKTMLGHARRRWPVLAVLLLSLGGGGVLLGGGGTPATAAIGEGIDDPLSLLDDRSPGARPDGAMFATKGRRVVQDAVDSVLPRVRERNPELSGPGEPVDEVAMLVPDPVALLVPPVEVAPDAPLTPTGWGPPSGGGTPGFLVPIGGGGGGGGGGGDTGPGPDPVIPAVPEPSTWAMMLLGFFLLGATLRARGGSRLIRRVA